MKSGPSKQALTNFYKAIRPALIRIAKENKEKGESKS
jgi:hypothetical protein